MFFVESNMCQFDHRHPATNELVWKCFRLLTNAPWLIGLGRTCAGGHKHTPLEGRFTSWRAAYAPRWCEEYASLTAKAPRLLKMLVNSRPVMATDNNFKHVSSVSLLRHWPEHPSYFLTGDMEAARISAIMSKVSAMDSQICPLYEDDDDTATVPGPGQSSASSSGHGSRTGEVFDAAPDTAAGYNLGDTGKSLTEADEAAEDLSAIDSVSRTQGIGRMKSVRCCVSNTTAYQVDACDDRMIDNARLAG